MIRFFLKLLDRLFPPSFERITESFVVAQERLANLGYEQMFESNRQYEVAREAERAARVASEAAERAYRTANRITELLS